MLACWLPAPPRGFGLSASHRKIGEQTKLTLIHLPSPTASCPPVKAPHHTHVPLLAFTASNSQPLGKLLCISMTKAAILASPATRHAAARTICLACATTTTPPGANNRSFSSWKRPPPNYPGHVPLTRLEQAAMAIGSSAMALVNPYRAGACLLSGPLRTHCLQTCRAYRNAA